MYSIEHMLCRLPLEMIIDNLNRSQYCLNVSYWLKKIFLFFKCFYHHNDPIVRFSFVLSIERAQSTKTMKVIKRTHSTIFCIDVIQKEKHLKLSINVNGMLKMFVLLFDNLPLLF
jgi:hypothetical protein